LLLTKKGDKRTKPLRPPVRPLHRLVIGAQHTLKHLDSCPIMVVIDGPVRKAGHAGAPAIGTYCERGQLAIQLWCAVFGEVNELVSCSSICRLVLPFSQETRAAAQISRQ
jgi:hypothetical protein